MNLNLVQFFDRQFLEGNSQFFKDDACIIAADFSQKGESLNPSAKTLPKFYSCKVFAKKDNNEFSAAKKLYDFVAVRGTSPDMCSFAASQKANLLLQPFNSEKCMLDMPSANVARESGCFVAFLFNDFLESEGMRLSQLLKNASMAFRIANSAGCKILFLSGAKTKQHMRASKDLVSFACLLGAQKNDAIKFCRENPKEFLEGFK